MFSPLPAYLPTGGVTGPSGFAPGGRWTQIMPVPQPLPAYPAGPSPILHNPDGDTGGGGGDTGGGEGDGGDTGGGGGGGNGNTGDGQVVYPDDFVGPLPTWGVYESDVKSSGSGGGGSSHAEKSADVDALLTGDDDAYPDNFRSSIAGRNSQMSEFLDQTDDDDASPSEETQELEQVAYEESIDDANRPTGTEYADGWCSNFQKIVDYGMMLYSAVNGAKAAIASAGAGATLGTKVGYGVLGAIKGIAGFGVDDVAPVAKKAAGKMREAKTVFSKVGDTVWQKGEPYKVPNLPEIVEDAYEQIWKRNLHEKEYGNRGYGPEGNSTLPIKGEWRQYDVKIPGITNNKGPARLYVNNKNGLTFFTPDHQTTMIQIN